MPTRKVRTVNLAAWTDERPGMHCRSVLYAERVVNIGILIGFSVGFGGYPRSGGRVRSPLQSDRRRSNFGGSDGKLRQRRKTAGPDAGGESPSGDDATVLAGYFRVGGEGFVSVEVQVALGGEAERAAHGAKLDEAHVAELGAS